MKTTARQLAAGLASAVIALGVLPANATDEVFRGFTGHIGGQIQSDKKEFVDAETCTIWFYKQQQQPTAPPAKKTSYSRLRAVAGPECSDRFPNLETARGEFSRTQSVLSVSLTFYEFALVGDRNDDGEYNAVEIKDMLEAFGLAFEAELAAPAYLEQLNAKFDGIHRTASLEPLMSGLSTLYDRGYRFSPRDRAELDKISQ